MSSSNISGNGRIRSLARTESRSFDSAKSESEEDNSSKSLSRGSTSSTSVKKNAQATVSASLVKGKTTKRVRKSRGDASSGSPTLNGSNFLNSQRNLVANAIPGFSLKNAASESKSREKSGYSEGEPTTPVKSDPTPRNSSAASGSSLDALDLNNVQLGDLTSIPNPFDDAYTSPFLDDGEREGDPVEVGQTGASPIGNNTAAQGSDVIYNGLKNPFLDDTATAAPKPSWTKTTTPTSPRGVKSHLATRAVEATPRRMKLAKADPQTLEKMKPATKDKSPDLFKSIKALYPKSARAKNNFEKNIRQAMVDFHGQELAKLKPSRREILQVMKTFAKKNGGDIPNAKKAAEQLKIMRVMARPHDGRLKTVSREFRILFDNDVHLTGGKDFLRATDGKYAFNIAAEQTAAFTKTLTSKSMAIFEKKSRTDTQKFEGVMTELFGGLQQAEIVAKVAKLPAEFCELVATAYAELDHRYPGGELNDMQKREKAAAAHEIDINFAALRTFVPSLKLACAKIHGAGLIVGAIQSTVNDVIKSAASLEGKTSVSKVDTAVMRNWVPATKMFANEILRRGQESLAKKI